MNGNEDKKKTIAIYFKNKDNISIAELFRTFFKSPSRFV
jgi:hypothetical protein